MRKHNYFVTFLKKINLSINSLLKKYLNKLNFKNFSKIAKSDKFFLTFVTLIILFISYLSIPNIYNKVEIRKVLQNQLLNQFNLNFNLSQNLRYSFFPRPHFIYENATILKNQEEISKIKELKIYISLKNLFSLEGIKVNDSVLKNANFYLNNQTYDFFTKLLSQNFKDNSFIIKDSNIFYRNTDNEVLFINKIINMKYYYNIKDLKNIFVSKNEIFNLPYSLELYDNKIEKKIFSKLNLNFLNLQIENEINYTGDVKKGSANLIVNQNKSNANYELKKNSFVFIFFNKLVSQDFSYKGMINFKPFYSNIEGAGKEINFSSIFNSNGLLSQLFKTGLLNNRNINFEIVVNANKIKNYNNFVNIFLNSKMEESLLDFDNTKFAWKDIANFEITNSLMHVKDNEIILDGKLDTVIKNHGDMYKFLVTPKKYRKKIKKIDLNFTYNFDQKILKFDDIKINNKINQNVNEILKSLIFEEDRLKNKIYIKNVINKAIKAYVG